MEITMNALFLILLALFGLPMVAQDSPNTAVPYAEAVKHFDYDAATPLDVHETGHETGVETRDGVQIHDITYAGAKGPVPAYLVVPGGKGPFAAILWGHWMMKGSPNKGRQEFLPEAVVLAKSGVVSLLIDAPMVRPEYKPQEQPLDTRDDVIDLRRGLDLLIARKDVDPSRLAYVGHSFHAAAGALLSGVDKRPKAYVLMAGAFDYDQYLVSQAPEFVALRKKMPEARLHAAFAEFSWTNPCQFVAHAAPADVLLQNGTRDDYMTVADIDHYSACVSAPKETKLYDAGHALNPQATKDRDAWLQKQLGLKPVDMVAIGKLPQPQ